MDARVKPAHDRGGFVRHSVAMHYLAYEYHLAGGPTTAAPMGRFLRLN